MENMEDILILDKIKEKYDKEIVDEIYHFDHNDKHFKVLNTIVKKEPMTVHGMSMNVWNRIVQYKLKPVDPMAIAKEVDDQDPFIFRKISKIIREPILQEVFYCESKIIDTSLKYNTTYEIMIGKVFPNDIHLADIEISNPYQPIPKSERKHPQQHYKGLGLLKDQIGRLIDYCYKSNCGFFTLTAATKDQYNLFRRYGFEIEDNEAAKIGLEIGLGISMEMKINGY